jgi:dipeptidyl aminopeptidase/acylaminoacyl peptidase
MLWRISHVTAGAVAFMSTFAVWAQPSSTSDSLSYAELVLAPDANQIAVVETAHAEDGTLPLQNAVAIHDKSGRRLWAFDPCAGCRYTAPDWSPDGQTLAFLGVANSQTSIFEAQNGQVRKITQLPGVARNLKWSPDGKSLAFLITAQPHDGGHAVGQYRRSGVIEVPHDTQRITVLPPGGGDAQPVSPDGLWVYEFDWRPDTSGFVAVAAEGDADNLWYRARLVTISRTGGVHDITLPRMQIARPRVSPDGKKIAFIGGLMSDEGYDDGDVFITDLATDESHNVTKGFRGTINSVSWSGSNLVAGITLYGSTGTALIDPAGHKAPAVSVSPETIDARDGRVSVSANGKTVAYVAESFNSPAHLVLGAPGAGRPITPSTAPNTGLDVSVQDVRWHSDGRDIQGWLLTPRGATPVRRLIVDAHGGPTGAVTPFFVGSQAFTHGMVGNMLRAGYAVFFPNFRGSTGEGEEFVVANVNDMGDGPLRDVLSGLDTVERMLSIDDRHAGLFGYSYGGFFTMWAATHTQRFAAIVSGAGMADWTSYYSQTVIPAWVDLFLGGPPYTNMEAYDRASPIRYLKDAKTPTLLENGDNDSGAPPEQAEAFWRGLLFYKVPTKFVLYPGESHHFHDPTNIRKQSADTIAWFDQWLAK